MKRCALYVLLVLALLSGCRSGRNLSDTAAPAVWQEGSPQALFAEMFARHDTDTTAFVKSTAYLSLGKYTVRGKVQIRWRRDSTVQFSVVPLLGMEVCRITLTPDSLYIVDRFHKKYMAESLNAVADIIPSGISFAAVQSLLLAQPFLLQREIVPQDVLLFDIAEKGENYLYAYNPPLSSDEYRFEGDRRACLVGADIRAAGNAREFSCRYSDYVQQDDAIAPQRIVCMFDGFSSERVMVAFDGMTFAWNEPQPLSTGISARYKKTDLESWIKILLR